jgi:hypothetical protein
MVVSACLCSMAERHQIMPDPAQENQAKSTFTNRYSCRRLPFTIPNRQQQTCLRSIGNLVTPHSRQPASNKLNNSLHTFENAGDPMSAFGILILKVWQCERTTGFTVLLIPIATALPFASAIHSVFGWFC